MLGVPKRFGMAGLRVLCGDRPHASPAPRAQFLQGAQRAGAIPDSRSVIHAQRLVLTLDPLHGVNRD